MRGFVEPSSRSDFYEDPAYADMVECPECGAEIHEDDDQCDECGWQKDAPDFDEPDYDCDPGYIPPDYDPYGGP